MNGYHPSFDSIVYRGCLSTGFLYLVDVEKSRIECEEFVLAEAERKAWKHLLVVSTLGACRRWRATLERARGDGRGRGNKDRLFSASWDFARVWAWGGGEEKLAAWVCVCVIGLASLSKHGKRVATPTRVTDACLGAPPALQLGLGRSWAVCIGWPCAWRGLYALWRMRRCLGVVGRCYCSCGCGWCC